MPANIKNRKIVIIWLIIMVVFISELLLYTWCRVQCVQIKYEIAKSEKIKNKRLTMQNNLKIEYARLKSPERIVRIARNKLGLVMPKSEQIIVIP